MMLGTEPPGAWVRAGAAAHGGRRRCACPRGRRRLGCTISIGITDRVETDADWPTLYKRADPALYEAKEGGRDRVCRAAGAAPERRALA